MASRTVGEAAHTTYTDLFNHVALGHIVLMNTSIYFECPLLPNN